MGATESSPAEGSDRPIELLQSRQSAKQRLEDRISLGKALLGTPPSIEQELENKWKDYIVWHEYNEDLLKTLFGESPLSDQYGIRRVRAKASSLDQGTKQLQETIDARITKLTSIANRLELFPERIQQPPQEQQLSSTALDLEKLTIGQLLSLLRPSHIISIVGVLVAVAIGGFGFGSVVSSTKEGTTIRDLQDKLSQANNDKRETARSLQESITKSQEEKRLASDELASLKSQYSSPQIARVLSKNARGVTLAESIDEFGILDLEARNNFSKALPPDIFIKSAQQEIAFLGISLFRTFDQHRELLKQALAESKSVYVRMLHPKSKHFDTLNDREKRDVLHDITQVIEIIKKEKLTHYRGFSVRFTMDVPPFTGIMIDGDINPAGDKPNDGKGEIRVQPLSMHSSDHRGLILHFKKSATGAFDYFAEDARTQWKMAIQDDTLTK